MLNTFGTQWRDSINSRLTLYDVWCMMAIDGIDGRRHGKREEGEEPVSKHHIQLECGEEAG